MTALPRVLLGLIAAALCFMPLGALLQQGGAALQADGLDTIFAGSQVDVLLANSIFLALLTTLFAALLAVPAAAALGLYRFRSRALLQGLCILPLLIPPHIHTIAWTRVLGDKGWMALWLREQGWNINIRAPLAGMDGEGVLAHIYWGPAWVMACAFFPLMALPAMAALQRLDRDAMDAARISLGWRGALRRVALPAAAPQLLTGAVAVFALSIVTYPVVSLLDTPVLVQKVYFVFSQVDQGSGTLLALPLVLLSILMLVVLLRLERHLPPLVAQRIALPQPSRAAACVALTVLALSAGLPLFALLREAGPLALDGGTDNYQSVFARTGAAFTDSLLLVGTAVSIIGIGALLAGRMLAQQRRPLLDALAAVAFSLPPVAVGVAFLLQFAAADAGEGLMVALAAGALAGALSAGSLRLALMCALCTSAACGLLQWALQAGLARSMLEGGAALPVLGWLALYMPLCVRLMRQAFAATDADSVAAARVAGLSLKDRFIAAEWPAVAGTFAAVLLLAWVLCFTELSAVLLLLRPGWQFLQIRIFNMVHYQSAGEVAALCVLTVLLTVLPLTLVWSLRRRRRA